MQSHFGIFLIFLHVAVAYAQLLTTLAPYQAIRCSNTTDLNCYTTFPYPYGVYARAGPALIYGTTDYVDLCTDFHYPTNTTCELFFCDGNPFEIYNSTINSIKSQGVYYISFLHFCYYCNYTQRASFYQKLNAGKCPYYWKPPVKWYCQDQSPTLVSIYAFENYYQLVYNTIRSMSDDVPAMLNTTLTRTLNGQDNGTIETAISSSYYCYCNDMNRYGMQCNDITRIWIPIAYNVVPIISVLVCIGVLFLPILLVCWPRSEQAWRDTMGKSRNGRNLIKFVSEFFTKLPFHVIFFMVLGDIFLMIERCAALSPANSALRTMNGNFRVLGWFAIFASYTVLLIIWANIYERTSKMIATATVALKFKIMLAIFYIIDFTICLAGLISMNYLKSISNRYETLTIYRYDLNIIRATMDVLSFSITLLLSFGFLIYGLAMYRMLSQVSKDTSLWKLKFTRFMLMTVPVMWLTSVWLLLYVI
jgi:hypothetical protein